MQGERRVEQDSGDRILVRECFQGVFGAMMWSLECVRVFNQP